MSDRKLLWRDIGGIHAPARRITIRLPEGYASSDERYPVLYIHDNGLLACHDQLVQLGYITPCILVSVPSPDRNYEYTLPAPEGGLGECLVGGSEAYAQFLIQELKPKVDAELRTRPEAATTGTTGCSLGGLISMYLSVKHGDVFGMAGCLSPSLWWNDKALLNDMQKELPAKGTRFWLSAGSYENSMWHDARDASAILLAAGWVEGEDLAWLHDPEGEHASWYWKKHQMHMLGFLLGIDVPAPSSMHVEKHHRRGPVRMNMEDAHGTHIVCQVNHGYHFQRTAVAPQWDSADPAIITVNQIGKIESWSEGKTKLSAIHNDFAADITIFTPGPQTLPQAGCIQPRQTAVLNATGQWIEEPRFTGGEHPCIDEPMQWDCSISDTGLTITVRVVEDELQVLRGPGSWGQDRLELYIDLRPESERRAGRAQGKQSAYVSIVPLFYDEHWKVGGGALDSESTRVFIDEEGYTVQTTLPHTWLNERLTACDGQHSTSEWTELWLNIHACHINSVTGREVREQSVPAIYADHWIPGSGIISRGSESAET